MYFLSVSFNQNFQGPVSQLHAPLRERLLSILFTTVSMAPGILSGMWWDE